METRNVTVTLSVYDKNNELAENQQFVVAVSVALKVEIVLYCTQKMDASIYLSITVIKHRAWQRIEGEVVQY